MKLKRISQEIQKYGYYLKKDFLSESLLPLAYSLGKPVPNKRDESLIKEIRPEYTEYSNPNTLSSRYGLSAFPYHTETAYRRKPIRYLMLYCQNPGSGGRSTQLVDFFDLPFTRIEERILSSEVWKVVQIQTPFLTTIFKPESFLRFDMACMVPAMTGCSEAANIIHERLSTFQAINIAWETNDLLIVDNFRMLHARGQAEKPDTNRILKRLIIEE